MGGPTRFDRRRPMAQPPTGGGGGPGAAHSWSADEGELRVPGGRARVAPVGGDGQVRVGERHGSSVVG